MNITRAEISRDVITSGGQATINAGHPSAEVRALTPSVANAYAEFEAQNAAALPLRADRKRISDELNELRKSKHPTREYDQTLDDELVREVAKLDAALTRNGHAAKKLAVDYLYAVVTNPRADETRQSAAKLALEAHAEAEAALAALEAALARRETFYASAGSPAEWKHHKTTLRYAHADGRLSNARTLIAQEVNGFPADDVTTVADGGEVMTLAELQSAARRANAEREAQAKAATRERERRQYIIADNAARNA